MYHNHVLIPPIVAETLVVQCVTVAAKTAEELRHMIPGEAGFSHDLQRVGTYGLVTSDNHLSIEV